MMKFLYFDYELTELGNIRDSFIKGLKAYFSAPNPYFFKDVDFCAKDKTSPFFKRPDDGRICDIAIGDYFKVVDSLRLKNATIFYHHYIEQILKLYLRNNKFSDPYNLTFIDLIRNTQDIKAVRFFRKELHELNRLRNILYHSKFNTESSFKLLGSDVIHLSYELFRELEYDFQSFFPYNSLLIHDLVLEYAKDVRNQFIDKQFPEVFYRIRIMANINWLEITEGEGELDEIDQKALDFKHGLYQFEDITELPSSDVLELQCPTCKNMMTLACHFEWENDISLNTAKNMFSQGEWPFCPTPDCIYCFYCGFFVPEGDYLVDFTLDLPCDQNWMIEELLKKWERNGLS